MATHSYRKHKIEVFTRDNGDFIEAGAKFKPYARLSRHVQYVGQVLDRRRSEQTVLEDAKRIIDNSSK
jgi:hypothetical protein